MQCTLIYRAPGFFRQSSPRPFLLSTPFRSSSNTSPLIAFRLSAASAWRFFPPFLSAAWALHRLFFCHSLLIPLLRQGSSPSLRSGTDNSPRGIIPIGVLSLLFFFRLFSEGIPSSWGLYQDREYPPSRTENSCASFCV